MTVRLPQRGLASGVLVLSREASRYLCRVRRLAAGAEIVLFDPDARCEADAVLEMSSADAARVAVGPLRPAEIVAGHDVWLVYALAKGDKVDDVVRDATELGVSRILVVPTERSVVKVDAAVTANKLARWSRVAEQAARQSGRADPPAVEMVAWADAVVRTATGGRACFCLHPAASAPLGPDLTSAVTNLAPLAFAIGPEGGFTNAEVALAEEHGFLSRSLGSIVLRTETVAAAVLGAVRILS